MQKGRKNRTNIARLTALCISVLLALALAIPSAQAASGTRTLYLYYTHTKETGKFTFRKNGRYDQKVLAQLNTFLRDWRRNEPTKMDPALFDLIWEVYQEVGASEPIHVVSAYRAPATNDMLRSKSSGVAKNSRHTMGMAMDFYIPGVPLKKLREAAMRKQVGGVGYYPTSGSPFVHLDTGNVRAWPRMTKAQLTKLFPDGETLHLPAEGNTPLSQKGYQIAKAEWTKCHTVPCSAKTVSNTFAVASADTDGPSAGNGKTLMDWLFGNDEADEAAVDQPAGAVTVVATAPVVPAVPPTPASRPASFYTQDPELPFGIGSDPLAVASVADAPVPVARPVWAEMTGGGDVFTVASIAPAAARTPAPAASQPEPQPLPPEPADLTPLIAAYAPTEPPEPDALRAVTMILERRAAGDATPPPDLNTTGLRSSLGSGGPDTGALSALISGSMDAIDPAVAPPADFELRQPRLVAPDLANAAALFVDPAFLSSERYAIIFDHEEADIGPATELGELAPRLTRDSDPSFGLGQTYFARNPPLLVASR